MIPLKKELKSDKLKFKLLIRHPLGTFKEEENHRRLCSLHQFRIQESQQYTFGLCFRAQIGGSWKGQKINDK